MSVQASPLIVDRPIKTSLKSDQGAEPVFQFIFCLEQTI